MWYTKELCYNMYTKIQTIQKPLKKVIIGLIDCAIKQKETVYITAWFIGKTKKYL